ncbi:MAG: TonB-dependent receptor [Leptospiraceae bacterium]|nr:TonB-dependent receptor [Leptospiraceae bacterium]MCP5496527.1 TonB-dependent receptor [Leptospiraceae bacterium]
MKITFSFEPSNFTEDEKRLFYSASFVFLLFSLVVAHLYTKNLLWKIMGAQNTIELSKNQNKERIYEVLIEQQRKDDTPTDQIKALSDKDSAGKGKLTEKEGFHTLTAFREFLLGGVISLSEQSETQSKSQEEPTEVGILFKDPLKKASKKKNNITIFQDADNKPTTIPANYRFQQDFLFNWDGTEAITIPTKKLVGFEYFKNMLKQIENRFAPPGGGNYAYRDIAGTVIREAIKPGETKVLFMLEDTGRVIDVKLVSSQGQRMIDKACLDSIRGQNFGTVPEEVKKIGLIFGINFIFPDLSRLR